jgi:hypothetical protein
MRADTERPREGPVHARTGVLISGVTRRTAAGATRPIRNAGGIGCEGGRHIREFFTESMTIVTGNVDSRDIQPCQLESAHNSPHRMPCE